MFWAKAYSEQIYKLKAEIESADAIVVGAGAGLSAAAGFAYDGERFYRHFSDFNLKYGITDMYSGGFYPYETLEEYWAWWSRHILLNRYEAGVGKTYSDLQKLIGNKNYFILTTNVDHQFQLAGFDKKRLFYTQGVNSSSTVNCSSPASRKARDNVGSYLLFSIALTVCLETPHFFASSSCDKPNSFLLILILFSISAAEPLFIIHKSSKIDNCSCFQLH